MYDSVSNPKSGSKLADIPFRWWIVIILTEIGLGILVGIIPSATQPELIIGLILLMAYFGLALIRPQIALSILVFSYPFYNITLKAVYQSQTYSYMFIPVVIAPLIAIAILTRTAANLAPTPKPQIFLFVPIFLLIIWSVFTATWAENKSAPWFIAIHFVIALSIAYSTLKIIQTEKIFRQILWVVFFAGLITATAIILSTVLSRNWVWNHNIIEIGGVAISMTDYFYLMSERALRAMGFGTYNQMALLMTIQLFIAAALLLTAKSRRTKWFLGLAMVYMLYAQVLTKTRAPMLGMLIGVVIAIYLLSQKVKQYKYKAIILTTTVIVLCIVLVVLSAVGNFDKGLSRYTSTASGVSVKDSSWTLRLTWLQNCLTYLTTSYGFGTGAGNVSAILYENAPHPHDTFLHLITELGLIGGIILLVMVISIIKRTKQALNQSQLSPDLLMMVIIFAGALVAFGFSLAFEYDYFTDPTWYYLALMLVPINLALLQKDKKDTIETP